MALRPVYEPRPSPLTHNPTTMDTTDDPLITKLRRAHGAFILAAEEVAKAKAAAYPVGAVIEVTMGRSRFAAEVVKSEMEPYIKESLTDGQWRELLKLQ